MAFASRLHWRLLIGTILVLMATAWIAPRFTPAPDFDENRVLAKAPAWPKHLSELASFRKAADAYVADRFPARALLIALSNRARMLIGVSGSPRVIVGRDGWLFYDDATHFGAARNDPPMSGPEIRSWLSTLAGRSEATRARGATYLMVIPPMKETIYPEHAPAWLGNPNPRRLMVLLPGLAKAAGAAEVLPLYDDMRTAKQAGLQTYSRHDTHWTGYGAYVGYAALMNRLHALGLADAPRPLSAFQPVHLYGRFTPRDLGRMLGVAGYVQLDVPAFTDAAAEARARPTFLTASQDWTAPQVIDTGVVGKPVLMMDRDSFSNGLLPFLYAHFSRIILAHNQDGFWRQDLIDRFKPDIVVLEVVESGLNVAMRDGGPPASAAVVARIDHLLSTTPSLAADSQTLMPKLAPPDADMRVALEAAKPAPHCNLEVVSLTPNGGGEATFAVSGWLSEFNGQITSPKGVVALSGPAGTLVGILPMDIARPDVASYFHDPKAQSSGFVGAFFAAKLPPGAYAAAAYRRSGKGWISCVATQPLSMTPAPSP